jgi:IclR family transcriptional regulator, acetate operon repressor
MHCRYHRCVAAGKAQQVVGNGPTYPISSVDNALRLLLMFRDRKRLRVSDAASSLNVASSTAHRLLAMLVHYDFVRQESDLRVYVPGPALLEMGLAAVRNLDIRTLARPILADLAARVDETVHIAQLEGGKIRYLAGVEGSRPLRVADRTGQLMPAHDTATGKALLAELTPSQLDELIPTVSSPQLEDGLTTQERADLDADLAQVRARGYAVNLRRAEDILSVAVVVRDRRDVAVAAINASAPAKRMTQRQQLAVVRQLHAAAVQLEELLSSAVGA